MSAVISGCGKYRYVLKRKIPSVLRWVKPVLFIMLNPSTADANVNDPTLRSILRISEHQGFTDLTVVNLFALRSPYPKDLLTHQDPIGPENDSYIKDEYDRHFETGTIVAAWGANKFSRQRAEVIENKYGPFMCLGFNKDNSPKHPLFLPKTSSLEIYIPKDFYVRKLEQV